MNQLALPKTYDPSGIEERWYAHWEDSGYFHVSASDSRTPFTIVIPPPNVTGVLHMGHALDNTLQDILIRYKRMDNFASLWVPGTDHAGIATQNVVEKALRAEGKSREELGRDEFEKKVWEWKEKSGTHIVKQLRRLGSSCDWSRERFTLDPGLSRAVRKVFVSLYQEGLIYRSSYLISWCPRCQTALSDLEVEYQELASELTYFDYETTEGKRISVATTRPETMLGDTAVAVNPKDRRFKGLVGKTIQHPFVAREFPIVADSVVEKEFGTGAVKVTPAHDPNDYDLGQRHKLEFVTILNEKAQIEAGSDYDGLDRLKARKKVVADLKSRGLFIKTEPYRHAVGHCQRCRTVIEPRISEQWFVKVAPLAKPAIDAVRTKKTQFVPENWSKTYLDWMENVRDWCISRQLWWGHRIPVWYCGTCSERTVTIEDPDKCAHCGGKELRQDSDVLDTWFSSALWPFSTLGWPEKTDDLKKFYPTSVLVTGFDIIFFWVARMMMMGLKFMGDVPFEKAHIHALIRDEHGKKMSKSKGNVVDPLAIMEKYGTDAFRFALTAFAAQGRDILLSEKRIEGYRNFINKLWNAARFVLTTTESKQSLPESDGLATMPDRWIRSRLNQVICRVRTALDEMKFNEAAEQLYQFTWHEFCDWYLELIKPHFQPEADPKVRASSQETILLVLDQLLRLLHPLVPFVTEEIWQKLPISREHASIMLAPYPQDSGYSSEEDLRDFSTIRTLIEAIRNIRSENHLPRSQKMKAEIAGNLKSSAGQTILRHQAYIETLAGLDTIGTDPKNQLDRNATPPPVEVLFGQAEVKFWLSLAGLVDRDSELRRLKKAHEKAIADCAFLSKRLSDPKYRTKAPAHLVSKDENKLKQFEAEALKLEDQIGSLGG